MRTLVTLVTLVALGALLGCEPELPPLEFHGERVVVGSDVVDRVCEGTLARLDREIVQIEARLGLQAKAEPIEVYILEPETIGAHCYFFTNCTKQPKPGHALVLLNYTDFDTAVPHELTHARLTDDRAVSLFVEGVAEALSPALCTRRVPSGLDAADFLGAENSKQLSEITEGYYVSRELVAWLLEEFGASAFLAFYLDVPRGTSASTMEATYREHFDRELRDDLFAHVRTRDDLDMLPPDRFGCVAPPAPTNAGVTSLKADLDCDADDVQNAFGIDDVGYVEWTLTVEPTQRLALTGDIPERTSLSAQLCACIPRIGRDDLLQPQVINKDTKLRPGTYRVRWRGLLDQGLTLDVELGPID